MIRPVTENDIPAILAVYAPFITDTSISYETEVPALEEFRRRVTEIARSHAWLVYETETGIAGYAYGSKHRERAAYRWTTEVSVYVDPRYQRRGIARALYTELFAVLKHRGYRLALAGISLPNTPSVALHESLGFEPVGIYKDVAFKLGEWHDTGWWQKNLAEDPHAPPAPIDGKA